MKGIVKLLILIVSFQTILVSASSNTKVASKIFDIQITLFVNGRVNDILLVITDNKNKQYQKSVKVGHEYRLNHTPTDLKKVVCYEKLAANVTLSQADLSAYSVFIFNTDQKMEKYNFINIQQKNIALKQAREAKNEALFNEISEQNVYNP